ncbi:MAG: GTPase HflX [Thermoflexales bacterium]|nr:GTPase HflX [Thermoflexales bacterium]
MRAFLVGVEIKGSRPLLSLDDSLEELALLAQTAGVEVMGQAVQRLERLDAATYVGSGKLEEIVALVEETGADLVLFDDELNPRHQRNLEREFGDKARVLDRTALILDIFAQHASTREGALQVELAQCEYRLPRLTRQWTHLARQAGGAAGRGGTSGVGLRGPGETQLEVDRRRVHERIAFLKRELEGVRAHRQRHRVQRKRAQVPVVAIVGYTNAGKSTLLNALSGADVLVEDKLFATLDPTTRRVRLPGSTQRVALFTDTVGFIQKLPTQLVAAFRATLEEIVEADMLLHVVDITHPNASEHAQVVSDTLASLETQDLPVLMALNKIDRLDDIETIRAQLPSSPNTLFISAARGVGLSDLLARVEDVLYEQLVPVRVQLPYRMGNLIALLHSQGIVDVEEHTEKTVALSGRIPGRWVSAFKPYLDRRRDS